MRTFGELEGQGAVRLGLVEIAGLCRDVDLRTARDGLGDLRGEPVPALGELAVGDAEQGDHRVRAEAVVDAVDRDQVQRGIDELCVDTYEHIALIIEAMAENADELGLTK